MAGRLKKIVILLLALFIIVLQSVPVLAADEPKFIIDIDNLNLQEGVSTSFIITLENAEGAKVASIEGIENFDILSKSQGSSTSIIGGNISYEEYLYYQIMPKTTGEFSLKANILYNGQEYESNILELTITDSLSDDGTKAQDLFVDTVISHTEAYLGEKVVITYVLYTRYDVESFGFLNYTSIDGVIAREIPAEQLISESVYIDGIRYAKYEVKQLIIDPMKSGSYTIPSFNLQVNVITDSNAGNMFGGGFGGLFSYYEPMYLQTEEKELLVKPLPAEGKPEDFSGIVGELNISGSYSKEEVNYNDSLSLLITASGNCNLDGFKSIFAGEISGFSVYETSKNVEETIEDNQYHIKKEIEAILVPKLTGDLQVTPVSISYFNPVTGKYERTLIPGADIKVIGDMPLSSGGSQAALIETVRIDQVNYSSVNITDDYFVIPINKQTVYKILIWLAALTVLAAAFVRLVIKRKRQDMALKSIYRQLMNAKDINEVYSYFCTMISHCYKLSLKANPISTVKCSLPDEKLAMQVAGIMEYMESSKDKKSADLKDKIRAAYHMILESAK